MIQKTYKLLRDISEQMRRQSISAFSASTAFFFFLSMVPMLIMLCTILPYTPLTEQNLVTLITDFTPDKVDGLVQDFIAEIYDKSAGILSVAVLATIWSAGKGLLALMRGLNAINGVEERRNYFVVRLVASFYTIVMLLVVLVSLFIMVFGNQLVSFALHRIPTLQALVSALMNFRFMFVWLVLTLLFAAVYAYVPDKKQRFREQIPGAIFTAVVWSVFSWGFSMYVEWSDFSIYGSLSIIIIVMLWLYSCMYILMVGAYLNQYMEERDRKAIEEESEQSKK